MSRIRWWAMYLTSGFAGCFLACALSIAGYRVVWRKIGETAREHADQAARCEGPYLAPVTLALILTGGTAFGIFMIRWLS